MFLVHEGKQWENGWFGCVGGWRDRFNDCFWCERPRGRGFPLSGVLLSLLSLPVSVSLLVMSGVGIVAVSLLSGCGVREEGEMRGSF